MKQRSNNHDINYQWVVEISNEKIHLATKKSGFCKTKLWLIESLNNILHMYLTSACTLIFSNIFNAHHYNIAYYIDIIYSWIYK